MQTFLPYQSFKKSAQVLDNRRLGKQRVETLQIMKTLALGGGWKNHPAVKMWLGHEITLMTYQSAICEEWVARGYTDSCQDKTRELLDRLDNFDLPPRSPAWLGDDAFHRSHRSNLLRKDFTHYSQYFEKDLPSDLPYVWPSKEDRFMQP